MNGVLFVIRNFLQRLMYGRYGTDQLNLFLLVVFFLLWVAEIFVRNQIAAAVLSLPGKYREVMVLYYEQGMRIREIAEALHMPLNSVSSRLRRAKALLRNEVEGGNDA